MKNSMRNYHMFFPLQRTHSDLQKLVWDQGNLYSCYLVTIWVKNCVYSPSKTNSNCSFPSLKCQSSENWLFFSTTWILWKWPSSLLYSVPKETWAHGLNWEPEKPPRLFCICIYSLSCNFLDALAVLNLKDVEAMIVLCDVYPMLIAVVPSCYPLSSP